MPHHQAVDVTQILITAPAKHELQVLVTVAPAAESGTAAAASLISLNAIGAPRGMLRNEHRFNPGMQRSVMDNEQEKLAATHAAQAPEGTLAREARAAEEARRLQDMLEDDDVRESLKQLHAHKAKTR